MRAARVHHAARRRGGGVAARGARAAAERMRRIGVLMNIGRGRSGSAGARRCICAGPAGIGLDRGPQRADRLSAGRERCRRACAKTRRNWSHSRRTSSWRRGSASVRRCKQATRAVPIVFVGVIDPVGAGFVESLARPGGNITGFIRSNTAWREMARGAQRDRAARDTSRRSFAIPANAGDRPVGP